MPKKKIRKSYLKRFKITGSGKILRASQNGRHIRINKSKRRIRGLKEPVRLNVKQTKLIKSIIS